MSFFALASLQMMDLTIIGRKGDTARRLGRSGVSSFCSDIFGTFLSRKDKQSSERLDKTPLTDNTKRTDNYPRPLGT